MHNELFMNTIPHVRSTTGPYCQRQELNKQHGGDLYKLFGFYVITVGANASAIGFIVQFLQEVSVPT